MPKIASQSAARSDLFARLKARGLNYSDVKRVVHLERPHDALIFEQAFKGRSLSQVFKQLEKWRALLAQDAVLLLNPELKRRIEQFIASTELMGWRARLEYARLGEWDLETKAAPTAKEGRGKAAYINSEIEITATNRRTKEIKRAQLPGGNGCDLTEQAEAWRRALQPMRIWDDDDGSGSRNTWTSRRSRQGWPLFTRWIVPRLYDLLVPHYKVKGHHSEKRDGAKLSRPALLPAALLQDILEILRLEYPVEFADATVPQIKAIIQRHLARHLAQRGTQA